jgi:hypothetical protein
MKRFRQKPISKYSIATLVKNGASEEVIEVLTGTPHLRRYLRQFERKAEKSQRRFATRNIEFEKPKKAIQEGYKPYRLTGSKLVAAMQDARVDIANANLVYIKAPKGNGKTEFYHKFVSELPDSSRVLALVHRRSLARALSSRLELACYLDEDKQPDRFVISIDSLVRFDVEKDQPYDVLLIDESEQVFRHLLSDTTETSRGHIFRVLLWLIRNAKTIICADADITGELTCYVVEKLRGSSQHERDNVVSIVNEWPSHRCIEVYQNKYHIIAELLSDIFEGKRVYVPVAKKDLADQICAILNEIVDFEGKPIKALVLTGETSDEEKAQQFFRNPNEEVPKYQVLIATSTLSTGVSIDVKWFDAVYGIFDHGVYTFQDCDQAISRVRNCETVKVWIHRGTRRPNGSEAELRSGPVKKELLTRSYAMPDKNGKLSEGDELYMDVSARIRWCELLWRCEVDKQFVDLKLSDDWQISEVLVDLRLEEAGREMLKFGRDPNGDKYHSKILGADNLRPEEFSEIENEKSLRGAKSHARTKFRIASFFELASPQDVSMKHIKAYHEDGIRDVVKTSKLLKEDRVAALNSDRYERENTNSSKAFTSFGHRAVMRDFFVEAQKITMINHAEVLRRAKEHVENEKHLESVKARYSSNSRECRSVSKQAKKKRNELRWVVTAQQIDDLAKYVQTRLDDINLFFGSNFKDPTAVETKTKVFNTVMGYLGLQLKKAGKRSGDTQTEHFIDYDRVAELVATKDLTQLLGP